MTFTVLDRKDNSIDIKNTLEKYKDGFRKRRSFTDVYYVISDDLEGTVNDLENEFPDFGEIREDAYLKGVNPKEIATIIHPETGDPGVLYEVDVEYDSTFDISDTDNNTNVDDPPSTRPKRRWYTEKEEEVLERDADTDKPIVTGCNESIIIPHKVSIYVLEIERYEQYPFDPQIMRDYINTRNENTFYGAAKGNAVMDDITSEEELIENSQHKKQLWQKTKYTIKFRLKPYSEEGWQVWILHEGYLFRPTSDASPRIFLDPETKQPRKVLLITDPETAPFGEHGVILPENADPNYLRFNRFPAKDWGPLSLEY